MLKKILGKNLRAEKMILLTWLGMIGIGVGINYQNHRENEIIQNAYNSVLEHKIYMKINLPMATIKSEKFGIGFVDKDKYLTLTHVTVPEDILINIQTLASKWKIIDRRVTIDNIVLETIVENKETDVAVYLLPEELCKKYCNDGFKKSNDYKLGDEVFWIGNPNFVGKAYRKGHISMLDVKDVPDESFKGSVGIDKESYLGTSGSPVLKKSGELIGVMQWANGIGFFKKIEYFEPYLNIEKPSKKNKLDLKYSNIYELF